MAQLILESFAALPSPMASQAEAASARRAVALSSALPEVLPEILRPDVNVAVWARAAPAGLAAALRLLAAAAPFSATAEGEPDAALLDLVAQLPCQPPLDLLFDIQDLAIAFAAIAGTCGKVQLRLEAISGRGCYRWHADAVGLRLLCTYRGAGTELLPIPGGRTAAAALDDGQRCPPVQLQAGAVAILKGEGFSGNAGAGCIHRSPPGGPGARARLLLCIDEPGRIPLE